VVLAANEVEELRQRVLRVADTLGKVLPASAVSSNPTVVTFSDGGRTVYYRDFAAYQRATRSGRVGPSRTMPGTAPTAVSQWTRAACEGWLAEHPA
jgi:hypothetical protein